MEIAGGKKDFFKKKLALEKKKGYFQMSDKVKIFSFGCQKSKDVQGQRKGSTPEKEAKNKGARKRELGNTYQRELLEDITKNTSKVIILDICTFGY